MLTVHLGAFDSLDHDRRRVSGPMGPSGGCHEPVIMIGRHQHELPAAVPGDLYGLAQRLVLELAEFPLELHRGRLRHHRLGGESRNLQNIRIIRFQAKRNHRLKLKWEPRAFWVNLSAGTEHRVTYDCNPPPRRDPRCRCGGVFAADGGERGGHARTPQSAGRELVDPKIAEHKGRIVKTTGDGMLVEFASVVDAVRCAVAVQQAMPEREAGVAADSCIELRIGINLGDVIVEGDDLYGDGVNIAARIEALADAGGVFVSNTVYDHVRDRLPFVFEDLGEQQVKNIARPVGVYRVRPESPPLTLPRKRGGGKRA